MSRINDVTGWLSANARAAEAERDQLRDQLERLRAAHAATIAELHQVLAERDHLRRQLDAVIAERKHVEDVIEAIEAERDRSRDAHTREMADSVRLRSALRQYGQHTLQCVAVAAAVADMTTSGDVPGCTCGLVAALAGVPVSATGDAGLTGGGLDMQADMSDRMQIASEPVALPAMDLLARLASGEGGRRTGMLKQLGWLTWTVTDAGLAALAAAKEGTGP